MTSRIIKNAVTGLNADDEVLPSAGECLNVGKVAQDATGWPYKVAMNGRPERYRQTFITAILRAETDTAPILGNNLEDQVADAIGTHIQLECIGGGEATLVIDGDEVAPTASRGISSNPNHHVGGQFKPLPEAESGTFSKEGFAPSVHVVKDNRRLKGKKRDRVGS